MGGRGVERPDRHRTGSGVHHVRAAGRPGRRAAGRAGGGRRLADLVSAEPGPCFGRIDRAGAEPLYVGRRGLRVDGEPLLVDWRAEAARPFYAATPARPLGLRRRRNLRLEILETSRDLLTEIAPGQAPSRSLRHGPPPCLLTGAAVVDQLRPDELTAVICADRDTARLAHEVGDRAVVVPASRARGLEFDAVVVVDPARIEAARPSGKRDLYVALTRATRRLTVIRGDG